LRENVNPSGAVFLRVVSNFLALFSTFSGGSVRVFNARIR